MRALLVDQTDFSPLVTFDPSKNIFQIQGESRPENTGNFYSKLISWLVDYQHFLKVNPSKQNLRFEFKFDYFNSTSAKFILDFLKQLETLQFENPEMKVIIQWYFDPLDEDMRDSGEEFSHLVKLPFEFVKH